jgi:hypothetical protein
VEEVLELALVSLRLKRVSFALRTRAAREGGMNTMMREGLDIGLVEASSAFAELESLILAQNERWRQA